MKKIFIILTVVAFFGCATLMQPESNVDASARLSTLELKEYNDILNRFVPVKIGFYVDESNTFLRILYPGILPQYTNIYIKKEAFIDGLMKYLEWEEKATLESIRIRKEITTINSYASFKYGEDWHHATNTPFKLTFFSQTESHHQFVLSTPKFTSTTNQFINSSISGIYVEKEQAGYLLNLLNNSEEYIRSYLQEKEKAKAFS